DARQNAPPRAATHTRLSRPTSLECPAPERSIESSTPLIGKVILTAPTPRQYRREASDFGAASQIRRHPDCAGCGPCFRRLHRQNQTIEITRKNLKFTPGPKFAPPEPSYPGSRSGDAPRAKRGRRRCAIPLLAVAMPSRAETWAATSVGRIL